MPVKRTFRGKLVKRTKREGAKIRVIYAGDKGCPGQQEVVSESDYEKGISKEFVSGPKSGT